MAVNSGDDPEKLELQMTMGFSGKIVELGSRKRGL